MIVQSRLVGYNECRRLLYETNKEGSITKCDKRINPNDVFFLMRIRLYIFRENRWRYSNVNQPDDSLMNTYVRIDRVAESTRDDCLQTFFTITTVTFTGRFYVWYVLFLFFRHSISISDLRVNFLLLAFKFYDYYGYVRQPIKYLRHPS